MKRGKQAASAIDVVNGQTCQVKNALTVQRETLWSAIFFTLDMEIQDVSTSWIIRYWLFGYLYAGYYGDFPAAQFDP